MTSDRVSDEMVGQTIEWCQQRKADKPWYGEGDESPKMVTTCDFMVSILTELQHLRSPVTVSNADIEKARPCHQGKPHHWKMLDRGSFVCMWCGNHRDWLVDKIKTALVPAEQEGERKPKVYCAMLATGVCDLPARLETAEASLAAAREALEPFAEYADAVSGRPDYFREVGWIGNRESDGEPAEANLTAADFRRARAALARSNGNEP